MPYLNFIHWIKHLLQTAPTRSATQSLPDIPNDKVTLLSPSVLLLLPSASVIHRKTLPPFPPKLCSCTVTSRWPCAIWEKGLISTPANHLRGSWKFCSSTVVEIPSDSSRGRSDLEVCFQCPRLQPPTHSLLQKRLTCYYGGRGCMSAYKQLSPGLWERWCSTLHIHSNSIVLWTPYQT